MSHLLLHVKRVCARQPATDIELETNLLQERHLGHFGPGFDARIDPHWRLTAELESAIAVVTGCDPSDQGLEAGKCWTEP